MPPLRMPPERAHQAYRNAENKAVDLDLLDPDSDSGYGGGATSTTDHSRHTSTSAVSEEAKESDNDDDGEQEDVESAGSRSRDDTQVEELHQEIETLQEDLRKTKENESLNLTTIMELKASLAKKERHLDLLKRKSEEKVQDLQEQLKRQQQLSQQHSSQIFVEKAPDSRIEGALKSRIQELELRLAKQQEKFSLMSPSTQSEFAFEASAMRPLFAANAEPFLSSDIEYLQTNPHSINPEVWERQLFRLVVALQWLNNKGIRVKIHEQHCVAEDADEKNYYDVRQFFSQPIGTRETNEKWSLKEPETGKVDIMKAWIKAHRSLSEEKKLESESLKGVLSQRYEDVWRGICLYKETHKKTPYHQLQTPKQRSTSNLKENEGNEGDELGDDPPAVYFQITQTEHEAYESLCRWLLKGVQEEKKPDLCTSVLGQILMLRSKEINANTSFVSSTFGQGGFLNKIDCFLAALLFRTKREIEAMIDYGKEIEDHRRILKKAQEMSIPGPIRRVKSADAGPIDPNIAEADKRNSLCTCLIWCVFFMGITAFIAIYSHLSWDVMFGPSAGIHAIDLIAQLGKRQSESITAILFRAGINTKLFYAFWIYQSSVSSASSSSPSGKMSHELFLRTLAQGNPSMVWISNLVSDEVNVAVPATETDLVKSTGVDGVTSLILNNRTCASGEAPCLGAVFKREGLTNSWHIASLSSNNEEDSGVPYLIAPSNSIFDRQSESSSFFSEIPTLTSNFVTAFSLNTLSKSLPALNENFDEVSNIIIQKEITNGEQKYFLLASPQSGHWPRLGLTMLVEGDGIPSRVRKAILSRLQSSGNNNNKNDNDNSVESDIEPLLIQDEEMPFLLDVRPAGPPEINNRTWCITYMNAHDDPRPSVALPVLAILTTVGLSIVLLLNQGHAPFSRAPKWDASRRWSFVLARLIRITIFLLVVGQCIQWDRFSFEALESYLRWTIDLSLDRVSQHTLFLTALPSLASRMVELLPPPEPANCTEREEVDALEQYMVHVLDAFYLQGCYHVTELSLGWTGAWERKVSVPRQCGPPPGIVLNVVYPTSTGCFHHSPLFNAQLQLSERTSNITIEEQEKTDWATPCIEGGSTRWAEMDDLVDLDAFEGQSHGAMSAYVCVRKDNSVRSVSELQALNAFVGMVEKSLRTSPEGLLLLSAPVGRQFYSKPYESNIPCRALLVKCGDTNMAFFRPLEHGAVSNTIKTPPRDRIDFLKSVALALPIEYFYTTVRTTACLIEVVKGISENSNEVNIFELFQGLNRVYFKQSRAIENENGLLFVLRSTLRIKDALHWDTRMLSLLTFGAIIICVYLFNIPFSRPIVKKLPRTNEEDDFYQWALTIYKDVMSDATKEYCESSKYKEELDNCQKLQLPMSTQGFEEHCKLKAVDYVQLSEANANVLTASKLKAQDRSYAVLALSIANFQLWVWCVNAAAMGLIVQTFLQDPYEPSKTVFVPPKYTADKYSIVPAFWVCWFILVLHICGNVLIFYVWKGASALSHPDQKKWDGLLGAILLVQFVDAILFSRLEGTSSWEFVVPLRALQACCVSETVREVIVLFISVLWRARNVFVVYFVVVCTSATLVHALGYASAYADLTEVTGPFVDTMLTMAVLVLSGDNVASLALRGGTALYVFTVGVVLILGLFYLVPALIAIIWEEFDCHQKEAQFRKRRTKNTGACAAFILLDLARHQRVEEAQYVDFLVELRKKKMGLTTHDAENIFHMFAPAANNSQLRGLDLRSFVASVRESRGRVLRQQIQKRSSQSRSAGADTLEDLKSILRGRYYNCLAVAVCLIQIWMHSLWVLSTDGYVEPIAITCTVLLCADVIFQILIEPQEAWAQLAHNSNGMQTSKRIDVLILFTTIVLFIVCAAGNRIVTLRVCLAITVFRLFTLSSRTSRLLHAFGSHVVTFLSLLGCLFLMMYVYAIYGTMWFRGTSDGLTVDPDIASEFDGLQHSSDANFDSLWSSFNTLVRLMVGGDWANVMSRSTKVVSWWGSLYFLSFAILISLMMAQFFVGVMLALYIDEKQPE